MRLVRRKLLHFLVYVRHWNDWFYVRIVYVFYNLLLNCIFLMELLELVDERCYYLLDSVCWLV